MHFPPFFNRHLVSHQQKQSTPIQIFASCFLLSHERAEPQHFRFVCSFLYLLSPSDVSQDPFADAADPLNAEEPGRQSYIHIRIQQRNGRKTLTTLQGLPKGESSFCPGLIDCRCSCSSEEYDAKKILKAFKKVCMPDFETALSSLSLTY